MCGTVAVFDHFHHPDGGCAEKDVYGGRKIQGRDIGENGKVQKTQISFSNRYNFAFVSLLPVRKKKERPEVYIVVTFGLGHQVISPRIDAVSEPYPGRFTHHVLVSEEEEIDEELMGWVKEAASFSERKR